MSSQSVISLESYLEKTRQLSKLGLRQARMLAARLPTEANRATLHQLLLLLLYWWERGAAAVDVERLLEPLQKNSLELQQASLAEEWDANWNALAQDTTVRTMLTAVMQNPSPWAPMVGRANPQGIQPLVIVDIERNEFSFARAWTAVRQLEAALQRRLLPLEPLTPSAETRLQDLLSINLSDQKMHYHFRQVAACALALRTKTLILSGGPGTGKTSVVMEILRALLAADQTLSEDRIVLCAPTGRAKARMGETVQAVFPAVTALTLHSLLVQRPDGSFRYTRENLLPQRVVVVDEASMVDLHLFAALLDAVADDAHLILLGDMHQLPSVDAGAVLGDLTEGFENSEALCTLSAPTDQWLQRLLQKLPHENPTGKSNSLCLEPAIAHNMGALVDHTIILDYTYRSTQGIQIICRKINQGDFAGAKASLEDPAVQAHVTYVEITDAKEGVKQVEAWLRTNLQVQVYAELNGIDPKSAVAWPFLATAFRAMLQSRVLVVSHKGILGRHALNHLAEDIFKAALDPARAGAWFHGQHVLLGHNHHDLGLFNGDLGIMVKTLHGMQAVFRRGEGFVAYSADLLIGLESAYAMTVHKSQGSEFDRVMLVLPEADTPLLNRQIYTPELPVPKITHKLLEVRPYCAEALSAETKGLAECGYNGYE